MALAHSSKFRPGRSPAGAAARSIADDKKLADVRAWQTRRSATPADLGACRFAHASGRFQLAGSMARSGPSGNQLETVMHKEPKLRVMRRTLGYIAARTDEMPLGGVAEPRKGRVKLKMRTALTTLIVGIAAGCKGLGEVEQLTDWLGRGARKLLRVWRRVPDTTLRDLIVKLEPEEIRKLIRHGMRQAHRRQQLKHNSCRGEYHGRRLASARLPVRVASMDGKATSTRLWDKLTAETKTTIPSTPYCTKTSGPGYSTHTACWS